MTHWTRIPLLGGLVSALLACVTPLPSGPSVMALPGSGKNFAQFQSDDAMCRGFAAQQTGVSPAQAASDSAVSSAVIGAAVGAAAGTLFGVAAHDPGAGAAIGAGSGLLVGSAAGASAAEQSRYALQQRYDTAYVQCMYANGEQVPVHGQQLAPSQPTDAPAYAPAPSPPRVPVPGALRPPAPPRGTPPPPPPPASSPAAPNPSDPSGVG
ncbi:MAG TPA: YMGG-like glycine zipper-containing protein [Myxococcota bacterium]|nr:YMGG-like glycine zipper-containing protein [Myxococcota bacterium]